MLKDKRLWIIAAYFVVAIYLLPMYPHGGSANELTRWATAASLIEKGSFEISWTEPLIGPNVDTAKVATRTYSNKAPGTALISAPIYALTRAFLGEPDASNIRISWFAMRFVASTLPLLLLAIWVYRRGADEFALTTLLFATPLFVYSLLFFSHVSVAVSLYVAFRLCFDAKERGAKYLFFAGVLSGYAVISEFPAVFAVAVFCIGLLLKDKVQRLRRFGYFALGGLPFVIFLAVYNNALFGSPLSMSYAYESFPEWAEVAGQGVFGIGFPSPANAYLLLLSPSRGLLFTSPILLLSIIAYVRTFDRKDVRNMVRLATVVVTIVVICGHGAVHGGWAFGPRYLILVIPFLLDPLFGNERVGFPPFLKGSLLAGSMLLSIIPALTFAFAPPEFTFPHNDLWVRFISDEGWFVPNLANVLGAESTAITLMPVAVCIGVALFAVAVRLSMKRFLAGALVGAIAVGIYIFLPLADGAQGALRRASIAERFFRPAGRLDDIAANAAVSGNLAARRSIRTMYWIVADARAYAPDDFPYLGARPFAPSPTKIVRSAIELQKQGRIKEAEDALRLGEESFSFAQCEFGANLAVLFVTTGRRDEAIAKLESVRSLVDQGSSPECQISQFQLGELYRELGRVADADAANARFLASTVDSKDRVILEFRKQAQRK